jgi:hypothetical protein
LERIDSAYSKTHGKEELEGEVLHTVHETKLDGKSKLLKESDYMSWRREPGVCE